MQKTIFPFRRVKGFRLLLILTLALALIPLQSPFAALAQDAAVTPQEAYRAALAWLHICPDFYSNSESGGYTPASEMLEIQGLEGKQTIAYVMELQPAGFIIVTPSFDLLPIISYSNDSLFIATESPENILLDMLRSDIPARLKAVEEGAASPAYEARARATWTSYLDKVDAKGQVQTGGIEASLEWDVDEGPFVTSTWNQGTAGGQSVWNYYTPLGPDGSAGNYVCGCVATALGQILNYYEWPNSGTRSHSYTWNNGVDLARTLSADFGSTTYDWANAQDSYSASSTPAQRQAAGLVTYHAGVAVNMNYSSGGSGASTSRVATALPDYFRHAGEWVENTGSSFYDRLYANMLAHRPGELSIRSTEDDGHAVVIDGVQHDTGGPRYYHLNMGWGGYEDNWYQIEIPFDAGAYTWNTISGAVLDIVPTPDLSDPGATIADCHFPVSWDVSTNLGASAYELQQMYFATTLDNIADDAESGTGNWTTAGNWETNTARPPHSVAQTFRGYITPGVYYSTMQWADVIMIAPTSSISYWWHSNYFGVDDGPDTQARLEISRDGSTWSALRTHTQWMATTWTEETVAPAELAAYVGDAVFLRFVVEHNITASFYNGDTYAFAGFFVDDFAANDIRTTAGWVTLDDSITPQSETVSITENGDYGYRVRANASAQWWDWSEVEDVTVDGICTTAATGNWHTGGTWTPGSAPTSANSAIIMADHTVTVDGNADCHDLRVEADGILVVPNGSGLNVGDNLTNDGMLQQTRDVNGTSSVGFLDTGGYGGVLLNANGLDLGSTEVVIRGNQDCTGGDPGSSVRRCLEITPDNDSGRNATMRMYFSADDLGTIACGEVQLWHWAGLTWEPAGTVSGRGCATEPYYVEVTGVTDFSPFVADNNQPDAQPTVITLSRFEATPAGAAIQVEWETATEIDNLGFNLYRSTGDANGAYEQLNEALIPSQVAPGSLTGTTYTWEDGDVAPGETYYYKLEDVDIHGTSTFHGPVEASLLQLLIEQEFRPRRIGP